MKQLLLAVACLFCSSAISAEDWPQWRGPRLDGSSREKGLPLKWSPSENVAWKTPIPGIGHSSPIVVGDRVFVTTCLVEQKATNKSRLLLCIDRTTGKVLWQREVCVAPLEAKHKLNSYASATPASDGKLVYVTFLRSRPMTPADARADAGIRKDQGIELWKSVVPEMVVAAYDMHGDKAWKKVPGRFYSRHGFSNTPILHKDLVIINADQDATAYIVALDKSTGKERWRVDRPNRIRSYCVPLIVDAGGRTQLVLTGSNGVDSYDPDTGKHLWHIEGPTEQYVASPVYGSGLLFMTAGFPTYHNWTVRPDGTGDITDTHIVWHENKTSAMKASYVPSPLAVGDWFWMISDKGYLSCFEAKSGKRLWMEQLGDHHSGSPVLAGGHVYVTDDAGVTHVLRAGGKFELVSQNPLGEECYSSPAVSRGQIFIRTERHLWCVGK
jgi:outer membrane protein assembly factor BamB